MLGNAWGFVPNDRLKSSTQVIHSLIEIVAKGGSLLLGVGPKPDGTLSPEAVERLKEIGDWMNKNGEAIYNTRSTTNYQDRNIFFTQNKTKATMYALVCVEENDPPPQFVEWNGNPPAKGSKIKFLQTGENVKWTTEGSTTKVFLPSSVLKDKKTYPALAFAFEMANKQ